MEQFRKFEPMLNLALETRPAERLQTEELNLGFDAQTKDWEVIVKYHGSLEDLESQGIRVEKLQLGYGILTVPEEKMTLLEEAEQIEYVEKPKSYYYSDMMPAEEPCTAAALAAPPYLSGQGILIAILDSGVNVRRPEFLTENKTTRILGYLDFTEGREYSKEQLDDGLQGKGQLPSLAGTEHGTAVAGVAAGFYRGENNSYSGIAYKSSLLVINLGQPGSSFFQTANIMRGVDYALKQAEIRRMPLVLNLSFGNNFGSHRGDSLLERYLDSVSQIGKTAICVGAGNEGLGNGHYVGKNGEYRASFMVGNYERRLSLQIWKPFHGRTNLFVTSPDGQKEQLSASLQSGKYILSMGNSRILVYFGEPTPYTGLQEIYLEWVGEEFIQSGIWTILGEGPCDLYLNSQAVLSGNTGFLNPDPNGTLTIPATADRVISVGAYDWNYNSYAGFSGRGFENSQKPNLVAPGVGIRVPWGEGYLAASGTSFATPMVSGAAAILMEQGIVRGKDPYLYGEKLRAYLCGGATPFDGKLFSFSEKTGWGALCLKNSLNFLK